MRLKNCICQKFRFLRLSPCRLILPNPARDTNVRKSGERWLKILFGFVPTSQLETIGHALSTLDQQASALLRLKRGSAQPRKPSGLKTLTLNRTQGNLEEKTWRSFERIEFESHAAVSLDDCGSSRLRIFSAVPR